MMDNFGKPIFDKIKRCLRCGMPQTSEQIDYDELEICKACRSSEQKMHINWREREKNLRKILDFYKERSGNNYDCIVPISGGKDSAFQLYILTQVYKVKPLAVTFSHAWYSKEGRYNLRNILEKVNVDHFEFTPNTALINKLAKKSLNMIGDSCWHCHTGVEAIPFHFAVKFNIPLIVYGESMAEFSGKTTYFDNPDFDPNHFVEYSAIYYPRDMIDENISEKDLFLFNSPSKEAIEKAGVTRIFLGDFIFWDAERQTEFVRDYLDWHEDIVEGTFKHYKSVECIMPGVHDYSKYLKRGFGRGTDFACQDIRSGLLTREQGIELHKEYDPERPEALNLFMKLTDTDEDSFEKTLIKLRKNEAVKHMGEEIIKQPKKRSINKSLQNALDTIDEKKKSQLKILNIHPEKFWPTYGTNENKKSSAESISNFGTIPSNKLNVFLTASESIKLIQTGNLSVAELIKSYLNHIEKIEPKINAWVHLDPDLAMSQATLIDQLIYEKQNVGPLFGVPVGVKDVFNTANLPTEMGSPIWKGFTPGNDARAVYNLRVANAVIMGKTVTAEFAIHNPGPTVNPYDQNRSPGTSSSGSAAAVASRMVPLAIGTQTAGSTIRPASYCGIYGMKPSFGIIPRTGVLKTLDVLDHVSFLGLCIDDLKLMVDNLRVKGKNYPYVHKYLDNESFQELPNRKINIAFVKTLTWRYASEDVKKGVINFAEKLSLNGYNVTEIELPHILTKAHDIHSILYNKSISYYFKDELRNHPNLVSDLVKDMIEEGNKIDLDIFKQNLKKQNELEHALSELYKSYDIILTHSTADVAHNGLDTIERPDPCLIWTLCRAPAINLPVGKTNNGLPFGIQVVGQRYRDYFLLSFCKQLENLGLIPKIAPEPSLIRY